MDKVILNHLLSLSHSLGAPDRKWAILGEGNTSARLDDQTFLVKASGTHLASLTEDQVVHVKYAPLLDALKSDATLSDTETKDLLLGSCAKANPKMPSVETLFHAYLLSLPGILFIGHTHITSINSLMCSESGWEVVQQAGRLFPDEIVVCGIAPCCIPYIDPGLPLARLIREQVTAFVERYGVLPKTIYMQNHGFIAIGCSAREVVAITEMADKAAQILIGAISCGGPNFMSESAVERIANRPDEQIRKQVLGLL